MKKRTTDFMRGQWTSTQENNSCQISVDHSPVQINETVNAKEFNAKFS
jgi:hypothetical protein